MRPKQDHILSANALRAEVHARQVALGRTDLQEVGFGRVASVLYGPDGAGGHGNFLRSSYRRILSDPEWAARLEKVYTGGARLPRARDRRRGELECAGSSDALLMNIFCYPGVLRRPALCSLLDVRPGLRPAFGVRACLPMRRGEVDRTELDMAVGDLLVEAKLTETGFAKASRERLLRYEGVEEVFDVEGLPRLPGGGLAGYQLVRGILAARERDSAYLVLLDGRRADLLECCFRVLRAVQRADLRSRLRLRTWQEIAATVPRTVQLFLGQRYGIFPG